MAKKRGKAAEVRAGIVVLLALAILALGLFLVSGGFDQFSDKARYHILFRNSGGLVAGDAVFLEGRRVGKVVGVSTRDVTRESLTVPYVVVTIEVRRNDKIHVDSKITVARTITGIVTMNIEYGSTGQEADESSELFGRRLANFEEAVDQGHGLVADARGFVKETNELVRDVQKLVRDLDLAEIRDKLEKFVDSLNRMSVEAEAIVADARPALKETLGGARRTVGEAEQLVGAVRRDWDAVGGDLKGSLADVRAAAADLRAITGENRPVLKSLVQSLDDGARRVAPVLGQLEALSRELSQTVIEVRPGLGAAVRNARAALANFKAVTEDLKTAPWKLVNEPSGEEVREVHLYNAARLYVSNAAQIRELVDDLDTLRRVGVLAETAQAGVVQKVLERLQLSLAEFDKREKALVDLMVGTKK